MGDLMFNEDRSSGWLKIRGGRLACAKHWIRFGGFRRCMCGLEERFFWKEDGWVGLVKWVPI
jgi:hypothetical protein